MSRYPLNYDQLEQALKRPHRTPRRILRELVQQADNAQDSQKHGEDTSVILQTLVRIQSLCEEYRQEVVELEPQRKLRAEAAERQKEYERQEAAEKAKDEHE